LTDLQTQRTSARDAAAEWLLARINFERTLIAPYNERQLKLDRMRTLLVRLGQPDTGLKIVHVAGTKGKGSTAAMISAMLTAAGYRTGVFSSPHLERIEERFCVDGEPCTADELVALVDRLRPIVAAMDAEAAAEGDPQGGPTRTSAGQPRGSPGPTRVQPAREDRPRVRAPAAQAAIGDDLKAAAGSAKSSATRASVHAA